MSDTEWTRPTKPKYQVRVWINLDIDCYCVRAADLPGCVSQGETLDEALTNIAEAFQGVAEAYLERDGKIPWTSGGDRPLFTEERFVFVEVEATEGEAT